MKFGKNEVAAALVGIGFWGFLGGAAFGLIYGGLPSNFVLPEIAYWQMTAIMLLTLLNIPLGYMFLRATGKWKWMIATGGLLMAILNIAPLLVPIPTPWSHFVTIFATGVVMWVLVGWVFLQVELHVDGHAANLLSGWAGPFVGGVMGYLFTLNTVIAGIASSTWAMIFAGTLGFVIMTAGFVADERPQPKVVEHKPEEHPHHVP
jgi:hypothetical protein